MTDIRWQMVTCTDCGKTYQCTPYEDYFAPAGFEGERTTDNGYCWDCFMKLMGQKPQPEPSYEVEHGT